MSSSLSYNLLIHVNLSVEAIRWDAYAVEEKIWGC